MAIVKKLSKTIQIANSQSLQDCSADNLVNSKEHKFNILHIAAESAPFSTVGGMSSVIRYLSKTFTKDGHDVRIFMPKFGFIDEKKYPLEYLYKGLRVPTGHGKSSNKPTHLICNVKTYKSEEGITFYFLENMEYYEKRSNVYNYSDDYIRWTLLCYGALKYIAEISDWKPDVIHAHDWHTALVPNIFYKNYKQKSSIENAVTVLTIHNISFQGQSIDPTSDLNFDDGKSDIPHFYNDRLKTINFLRRGILYSDIVNTVSEGYARQILTKEYGCGLDTLLLELRSKLFGIVNGIDYTKFNPETDPLLEENFNISTLDKRLLNKRKLQKEFNLTIDKNIPIIGSVGRLDGQKGVDLLLEVIEKFLKDFTAQFVLIGSGDQELEKSAQRLAGKFPHQVGVHTYPNFTLPKIVFGGADIVTLPSRFEPCGIVQMEAMRYGAIPVVRATGGLDDTVEDFDPATLTGNGFKFKDFDGWSLYGQLVRAVETYRNKSAWRQLQINAMSTDFSWDSIADKYVALYNRAIHFKKEGFFHKNLD